MTELVAGVDIVREQFLVAAGRPLRRRRRRGRRTRAATPSGHAIEVRITAEDPSRGVRADAGSRRAVGDARRARASASTRAIEAGDRVPPEYDNLIAKLHGPRPRPRCGDRSRCGARSTRPRSAASRPRCRSTGSSRAAMRSATADLSTGWVDAALGRRGARADGRRAGRCSPPGSPRRAATPPVMSATPAAPRGRRRPRRIGWRARRDADAGRRLAPRRTSPDGRPMARLTSRPVEPGDETDGAGPQPASPSRPRTVAPAAAGIAPTARAASPAGPEVRVRLATASNLADDPTRRVAVLAQRQAPRRRGARGRHAARPGRRTPRRSRTRAAGRASSWNASRRTTAGSVIREVLVDGFRFEVEVEPERRAALRERATRGRAAGDAGGPLEVRAVIPGKVVAVSVADGRRGRRPASSCSSSRP